MKKKAAAAVLMVCMALSAAACGTENTGTEAEETESSEAAASEETGTTDVKLVSAENLSDYVTLGEYKGLTIDRVSTAITDDEIETQIETELSEYSSELTEGTVQEGDTVKINYMGSVGGAALENGSEEDYDLVIGDAVLGEEFDNAVTGMAVGESKNFSVAYPEDYYDSDVAGMTVDYTVTVESITREPELTDEWVAANTDYTTVDEYRAAVSSSLAETEALNADSELYDEAWSQVVANCTINDYPEEDIEAAKQEYEDLYDDFLEEAGITLDEFLDAQDMSKDDYEQECNAYAQAKVQQNLIVQAIMEAEGLTMEDVVMDELKTFMADEYGYESYEDLLEDYGETEATESLALLRVERFIVDNATVNSVAEAGEELIANEAVYDDESSDEDVIEEDELPAE